MEAVEAAGRHHAEAEQEHVHVSRHLHHGGIIVRTFNAVCLICIIKIISYLFENYKFQCEQFLDRIQCLN